MESIVAGIGVAGWMPLLATIDSIELSDNVTKVYGSHVFKSGYQIDVLNSTLFAPAYAKGTFSYSGQFTNIPNSGIGTGAVADLLVVPGASTVPNGVPNLGGASSYSGSSPNWVDDHRDYMGAYLQDDWKVTPKLTLNLGIRWDL